MKSDNLEFRCSTHPTKTATCIDIARLEKPIFWCADCTEKGSGYSRLVPVSDYASILHIIHQKNKSLNPIVSERPSEINELIEEAKKSMAEVDKKTEEMKSRYKTTGKDIVQGLREKFSKILAETYESLDREYFTWKKVTNFFSRILRKYYATQTDSELFLTKDQIRYNLSQAKTADQLQKLVGEINEDLFLDAEIIQKVRESKTSKKAFKKAVMDDYTAHMQARASMVITDIKSSPNIVHQFPNVIYDHILKDGEHHDAAFFLGSSILSFEELTFLDRCVNRPQVRTDYRLVYRGSRDGFGVLNYITAVRNFDRTVTIIKTKFGKIFAFVLSGAWQNGGMQPNRFDIISISQKEIYEYNRKNLPKKDEVKRHQEELKEKQPNNRWLRVEIKDDKEVNFGGGEIVLKTNLDLDENEVDLQGFVFDVEKVIGGNKFQIEEIEVIRVGS